MVKYNKVALILFFLLAPMAARASSKIVDINFEGLIKVHESVARRYLTSLEGGAYSSVTVNKDIKTLYQSGYFSDVFIEKVETAGGLKLIFHVREKGMIASIIFRGNKKIKDKELMDAISLHENSLLDEGKIAASREAIRNLYEEKEFPLAEVLTQVSPLDTEEGEMELIFTIRENKGIRIRRISFVGNKAFSDKKLASQMRTRVKSLFSFVTGSGKLKDEKLEADVALLGYFYLNHGYLKAKIGEPQVSLAKGNRSLYITIPVYEGLPYKVAGVDIAGDIITTKEELTSKLKLKTGDIYSRQVQDGDVALLTSMYGDQAYAFANIYPVIDAMDETKSAYVTYAIEKGQKIYIERIDVVGNLVTRDKVIRREMQVKEASPYNKSGLDLSYRRLMQLGYFSDINFSTPRGSRDDMIILVVKVEEKPTGTFSIGAGFSSLESFIFTATVQKDNFFGLGIRGGLSANLSKLRQEFQFNMTDRYFLDTRWIFSTSLYRFFSALNRDFDQKSFGGGLSFGRELFPFFDVSMGYQIEDVSVTNFSLQVPQFFQEHASGLTSSLVSTVAYDRRDNRLLTSRGIYQAVSGEYAGGSLGGTNSFWKVTGDSRYFIPLPLKSVFKTRGLAAHVNSLKDDSVPLFERFFLGGINTLRGYDLNSIGPQIRVPSSATGEDHLFTYGGNRMLLFNTELEVPIYEPAGIRTVAFLDAGQAYGENEEIKLDRLRSNYGFGLRWHSPFGPLRFEWGFPIARRAGESPMVFNFSIGQAF